MNYEGLKYNYARKTIANCDKLSRNSEPRVVRSLLGVFKITKPRLYIGPNGKIKKLRQYSVSKSQYIHNGGGYTIRGLRHRINAAFRMWKNGL
jgi:hypothetical protein